MAFDHEARRRQRQEKAAARRESDRKKKRLLIRLGIVVAVLLICLVVILALPKGEETPAIPTQPVETDPTGETQTLPPAETVLHLVFGGDLNITDRVVASGTGAYNYTETFMDVAHLFADADIAALNFEGILADAPYGTAAGSAPQSLATALDKAGVDVLQLANSCSLNKGLSGLSATIDAVRTAGMVPLGVKKANENADSFVIYEVDGVRIAYVAFTKGMDGLALPAGSEGSVNVLYTDYDGMYQKVDINGILQVMSRVNSYEPDLTVAMLHWGSKLNDTISTSQKEIIDLLQTQGVDAIVGTHSHYVQKMELDAQGRFVAYSLGDFMSDGTEAGTEYSVILDLEVTRNNVTGNTTITNYSYTPIFTVHEENLPLRVVRIPEAMKAYENGYLEAISDKTYSDMAYALTRIEARTTGQ